MDLHSWLTIASCTGQLALALLALVRGAKSPLARPLALIGLTLFTFNASDLAEQISSSHGWIWIDNTANSILCAFVLHFILVFVGRRRELAWLLTAAYLAFGGLAATWAAWFLLEPSRAAAGSRAGAILLLVLALPAVAIMLWLLAVHLARTTDGLERARTWLVFGAVAVGVAGGLTDLLANTGLSVPRLTNVGTLLATVLLAVVALRFGLLERRVSSLLAVNILVFAALQILGYLAVFKFFGANRAMLALGTAVVTLALLPLLRELYRSQTQHRQRLEYHATLGRFAAQMAHDLRNPLAALKGAAQFLQEERARGSSLADQGEYLELITEQADRLGRVIDDYQRLARVEPVLAPLEVNELVREVIASQKLAAPKGVSVKADLAPSLPAARADRDLLESAIENLVRNAFEATPAGGTVTVRTEAAGGDGAPVVLVSVEDTGEGMDARVSERAFEDFFTTKAQGSGLGLAFVKRVAEAHGGAAMLSSRKGHGTTVRLRLPLAER
jgi:two-component system sensor histidine kinase HydH